MKNNTNTARQILRGMVLSLLQNGFKKDEVGAALERLIGEASRDDWQKALDSRERARGLVRRNSCADSRTDPSPNPRLTEGVFRPGAAPDSPGAF